MSSRCQTLGSGFRFGEKGCEGETMREGTAAALQLRNLEVELKSKRFRFKLKLEGVLRSWTVNRLSFFLRIRKHSLKLESKSIVPGIKSAKPKLRSKFIRNIFFLDFIRKRNPKPKKRELAVTTNTIGIKSQEAVSACSYCIARVVSQFRSIFENGRFGHVLELFLSGISIFRGFKFITGILSYLIVLALILALISPTMISSGNYFNQFTRIFKCLLDLRAWGL